MDAGNAIGLATNSIIAVAFLAVAVVLLVNAVKTRHVRHNPLGVATVILYLTCGGGHLVHTLQLLDVPLGHATAAGLAIQEEYTAGWHMWAIDILTAVAGITYWMMRGRFPALVSGAAVFEDLRARQRRAIEINDNIVQGLAQAKLAFDLGRDADGEQAVTETLTRARGILAGLTGKEHREDQAPPPPAHPGGPAGPAGGKPHV